MLHSEGVADAFYFKMEEDETDKTHLDLQFLETQDQSFDKSKDCSNRLQNWLSAADPTSIEEKEALKQIYG